MRRLSDLPEEEARSELRACCGASRWVERMLTQRPFRDAEEVFAAAARIWEDLNREDWLEAFAAHPRIGERAAAERPPSRAAEWSAAEQEAAGRADPATRASLAEANRRYEERFGHRFIVCATGKGADEMLGVLEARLSNHEEVELRIAAGEQLKITRLRLEKLLRL